MSPVAWQRERRRTSDLTPGPCVRRERSGFSETSRVHWFSENIDGVVRCDYCGRAGTRRDILHQRRTLL